MLYTPNDQTSILHQPLKFQKCLKNVNFGQNYERAMVHEPFFLQRTPLPNGFFAFRGNHHFWHIPPKIFRIRSVIGRRVKVQSWRQQSRWGSVATRMSRTRAQRNSESKISGTENFRKVNRRIWERRQKNSSERFRSERLAHEWNMRAKNEGKLIEDSWVKENKNWKDKDWIELNQKEKEKLLNE